MKTNVEQFQRQKDSYYLYKHIGLSEAARKTDSDFRLIQKVCKGQRSHTNGYKWKYKDKV